MSDIPKPTQPENFKPQAHPHGDGAPTPLSQVVNDAYGYSAYQNMKTQGQPHPYNNYDLKHSGSYTTNEGAALYGNPIPQNLQIAQQRTREKPPEQNAKPAQGGFWQNLEADIQHALDGLTSDLRAKF